MGKLCKIPHGSNAGMGDIGDRSNLQDIVGDPVYFRSFDVSKIDVSDIRNVLGESQDAIKYLCMSNKVNPWALFRPEKSSLVPGNAGDFAGYNHNAYPTTYFYEYGGKSATWVYNSGRGLYLASIPIYVRRGERPPNLNGNINCSWSYVRFKIYVPSTGVTFWTPTATSVPVDYSAIQVEITSATLTTVNWLNCEITGYYTSSTGVVIQAIEAVHPTVTISIGQALTPISVTNVNDYAFTFSEIRHYFVSQYNVAQVGMPILLSGSAPLNWLGGIQTPATSPIIINGSTAFYTYSEGYIASTGKYWRFGLQLNMGVSDIFTRYGVNYQVTTLPAGYKYFGIMYIEEVQAFNPPTI